MSKTRLELTWIGKDKRPKLEPRILLEDPGLSYHAKFKRPPRPLGEGLGEKGDQFDNKLIFGDNLLALKALEQEYAGKVKCVFIDPPYNTGSAFTHYDDGLEHSIWLSLMRDRLEIIRSLLSDDGSLWITIDDNEAHYLKVLCDEVFGRVNFVASVIWQKLFTVKNSAKYFSDMHEYVLIYAKTISSWNRNLLPRTAELDGSYSNPDNDPRGSWTTNAIQARNYYSQGTYEITSPAGKVFIPPQGTYWRVSRATFDGLERDNRIWWGRDGTATPRIKKFLNEAKQGVVPATLWFHDAVGTNAEAKVEIRTLFQGIEEADVFMTPKPEKLIKRIFEVATNPGDLILDSFAGSGTTGAVAHKMGRRWIMIELGDHCHTHIIPRLKKVIDGDDQGGISNAVNWQGGGGFRYYSLAPSLLEQDRWGNWVVNKNYNPAMLAEALCKLEGFTYAPSDAQWWNHGYSSEQDFIYVTTQNLSHQQLEELSEEVGGDRSLLVCCAAFRVKFDRFPNLTLKKIPKMVLSRCEWAHDDYSLNVANLPMAQPDFDIEQSQTTKNKSKKINSAQNDLFGE
ncbi:MAG: site-specific DNA-methyltransferase [Methylobacter sp.]|nr:site-specific DNA-methyltransferase [Methylobacter sp.]